MTAIIDRKVFSSYFCWMDGIFRTKLLMAYVTLFLAYLILVSKILSHLFSPISVLSRIDKIT